MSVPFSRRFVELTLLCNRVDFPAERFSIANELRVNQMESEGRSPAGCDTLVLLVRAGLTPKEALQTATINPARFLGMEKDLGTIEKGKIANLVLLDADPVSDFHNTTKISEVFVGGKQFDRPALDRMLKNAEAAAKSAAIKKR